jgi:predicted nuclease of restriction endonuclease-like (RecB) superfamily
MVTLCLLLKVKNENERNFYEIEAAANNWSVRELQRQYNSALFERLALSKDKKSIRQLAEKGQLIENPSDILKSHYVLEFLGLKEDSRYYESDLETAIIDKLEHFMLELGKGFLFEGRQRRFTFEGDSFFIDLVFYNRLLRCFVLFDLK